MVTKESKKTGIIVVSIFNTCVLLISLLCIYLSKISTGYTMILTLLAITMFNPIGFYYRESDEQ